LKLLKKFKNLFSYCPLSVRGFLALIAAGLCLLYFAKELSDVVAAMVGIALLFSVMITLLCLLFTTPFLKRQLKIIPHDSSLKYIASRSMPSGFSISRIRIPPFFYLRLERKFDDLDVEHSTHLIFGTIISSSGQNQNRRIITDSITLPYRGEYQCRGFQMTYGDILGLTKLRWFSESNFSLKAYPPEIDIAPLPIMAASAQIGDTETAADHRTGDLFDLRAYRPGDSLKRILWKVYARSGDLIVREPEPAIIPEGEVEIFIIARAMDDIVASAALAYIRLLQSQNIIFSISFLGSRGKIAKSFEEAEEGCIEGATTLRKDMKTGYKEEGDYSLFLKNLESSNIKPHRIVVFSSEELLNSRDLISSLPLELIRESEQRNILLCFASVPKESTTLRLSPINPNMNSTSDLRKKIKNFKETIRNKYLTSHVIQKSPDIRDVNNFSSMTSHQIEPVIIKGPIDGF